MRHAITLLIGLFLLAGCGDEVVMGSDGYWWEDDPRYIDIDPDEIDVEATLRLGDQTEMLVLKGRSYSGEKLVEMIEEWYGANQAHNFKEHPEAFVEYMEERQAVSSRGDEAALDSLDAANVTVDCPCHAACGFPPCECEGGGGLPGDDPPEEEFISSSIGRSR